MKTMTGYELTTTFWEDFSIADLFGDDAIKDTYKRAFKEWKTNYVYLTELVLVLNWKMWQHYENRSYLAYVYEKLWSEADEYACTHLSDDELSFFYRVTD